MCDDSVKLQLWEVKVSCLDFAHMSEMAHRDTLREKRQGDGRTFDDTVLGAERLYLSFSALLVTDSDYVG